MSDKSQIEWTDATWNPVTGCDKVSAGCDNCYAERVATRFGRPFLGAVEQHPERLGQPLRWKRPRRVFVNSVSDLFHPDVDDLFLAEVFAVMSLAPQHTFQILTKRHKAMAGVLADDDWWYKVWLARRRLLNRNVAADRREVELLPVRPLPNVWLGVSVEDQRRADQRIPYLLRTPAAVRFLSVEPLLGPVTIAAPLEAQAMASMTPLVDWVIVGGESGPGARPMHPKWATNLRDECIGFGIPFFFKQWGEWAPSDPGPGATWLCRDASTLEWEPIDGDASPYAVAMRRVGKGRAGRELDGRTWDEYPTTTERTSA